MVRWPGVSSPCWATWPSAVLRAEPEGLRFTDLDVLAQVYSLGELIELAESRDTGFDRRRFLDALASFRRFTSADLQVSPEEHERLEGVVST